jgi:hypothetical protein
MKIAHDDLFLHTNIMLVIVVFRGIPYTWRFWCYFYCRVHVIGFEHSFGFFYLFILKSLVTVFSVLAWYAKYLFLFQPIISILGEKMIKNDNLYHSSKIGNRASCRNVMCVCVYIYIYIYIYIYDTHVTLVCPPQHNVCVKTRSLIKASRQL